MKNKILVSFLGALLISLFPPSVFSQDTVVRIEPSSVMPSRVDEQFSVDIVIKNGMNVAGYQILLEYDRSALRCRGVISADEKDYYLSDKAFYGQLQYTTKSMETKRLVQLAAAAPSESNGNGILVTFKFEVIEVKASSLKLVVGDPAKGTGTLLSDAVGNLTAPNVDGASVTSATGKVCTVFSLKTDRRVRCVAYSPDGSILASSNDRASGNSKVYLWDSATGENLHTISDDEEPYHKDIYSIAFSPKDNWFAIGGDGGEIRVWKRGENQTWVKAVRDNDPEVIHVGRDVWSVAFSHDETKLACGKNSHAFKDKNHTVDVWEWNPASDKWDDSDDHTDKVTLKSHNRNVNSVAFQPTDSNILASADNGGRVVTWSISERKILDEYKLPKEGYSKVNSIDFSPDGEYLASGGSDGVIWWRVGQTDPVKTLRDPDEFGVLSVVFESNTVLLSGGYDKKIREWVWNEGDPKHQSSTNINSYIWSIAVNPLFDVIAIGTGRDQGRRSGTVRQFGCTDQGNFTVGGGRIDTELASLQISPYLISQVAYGENYTYFILDPQLARVPGVSGIEYRNCTITLDTSDYDFFMFPLIDKEQNKPDKIADLLIEVPITLIFYLPSKVLEIFDAVKSTVLDILSIVEGVKNTFEQSEEDLKVTVKPAKGVSQAIRDSLFDTVIDGEWKDYSYITYPNICLIKGKLESIDIRIEQDYEIGSETPHTATHTVTYEGTWYLEDDALAAPRARPMSLADYPPFQALPPEVREYLLRRFGEFENDVAVGAEAWRMPEGTSLLPNYPNPFNPETWIPYRLADAADIQITIYDARGASVRQLELGIQAPGFYTARSKAAYWDGNNENGESVASGVYFYRLRAGDYTATRRMVILK